MSAVLAIDVGGTKIALALVEGTTLLEKATFSMNRAASPKDVLRQIAKHAEAWDQATKVGVACTGHVQEGRVWAVNRSTLPTWDGVPLSDQLADLLKRPVSVLNDAHAMALAEWKHGAGRNADPFAFVTISTGVGAGIVAKKRLHTGANGLAAHLGHIVVDPDGPLCGCGQRGCLEAIAAGRPLDDTARRLYGEQATAKTLFEKAAVGDQEAEAAIAQSASLVARALATIQALEDPQIIAIGGSVGLAPSYIQRLESELGETPATFRPHLVPSELGADSALIGAALWASELSARA